MWLAATRASIDPTPHFEAIAELSNQGAAGGGTFMREMMGAFDESMFFQTEVGPRRVG